RRVFLFLKSRLLQQELSEPLVLGYSGGPDSKALLYLLLACQKKQKLNLSLAHIDHGWREESGQEALKIREEAVLLGIPCFSYRVEKPSKRNLEAEGRRVRLDFFQKVYRETGARSLLLAHQADDQAETILKRILEGSHPIHWPGIEEETQIEGMRVLRPLLSIPKKELLDWLQKKELIPFDDRSNRDLRFLRGRMREQILPSLSEMFGKEVGSNLYKMGQAASEIDSYLRKKCAPHWERWIDVEDRIEWDLSEVKEVLELKWLLKMWTRRLGIFISHETFQAIASGLKNRSAGIRFPFKEGEIRINRGLLICVQN
ncbi:MAG: tRNA lysidine(34) synthetase TilS, partial [Chlamydiales bacterium]|nr:tRNA lysidine(34) synthetase TilS [Chlamydiales bacterium]